MLQLPPLRERKQDIPLLLDHFLRELTERHGRGPVALDSEAQHRLLAYDWPGNVRELQNVLERALVLAEQDVIGPEHLPPEVRPNGGPQPSPEPAAAERGIGSQPLASPLLSLEEVERRHVMRVLEATGGSREEASRILGISRRTLTRMVQRWGLPPRRHIGA
jgi:DNA-binding NtrC family response regulator